MKISISFWVIISSLSIFSPFTSAKKELTEVKVTGKFGGKPIIIFAVRDREVELTCEFDQTGLKNDTKPEWSFLQNGKVIIPNVASSCKEEVSSGETTDAPMFSNCEVKYDDLKLELELKKITEREFGDYVCHNGDMKEANKTFRIQELVQLARMVKEKGKDKLERSVEVIRDQPLYLYCNYTGVHPNVHNISWFKDKVDITRELNNGSDLFENFSRIATDNNMFYGNAQKKHGGNYTCQVNLIDSKDTELQKYYPVKFSFFVRIKEGNEWLLPMYVLLGECAVIGIFTLIITWKEKHTNEDDLVCDDSDDEDEASTSQSKGTQNNNSNSNGK